MTDCVFCKIIAKELPAAIVAEDDDVVVFKDIHPKAKTHLLIVPKKHIATVSDLADADGPLAAALILKARDVAHDLGLSGYQLSFNVGASGGQVVFHIHLHLLSND